MLLSNNITLYSMNRHFYYRIFTVSHVTYLLLKLSVVFDYQINAQALENKPSNSYFFFFQIILDFHYLLPWTHEIILFIYRHSGTKLFKEC